MAKAMKKSSTSSTLNTVNMHFSKRRANQRERLEMSEVRDTMSAQTDSDPCLVLQGNTFFCLFKKATAQVGH